MLRFTLRRDGVVLNPEVIEVTGHDSFREAALQALAGVGQLPRFPDEIRRRELLVEVPINYRIVESPLRRDGVVLNPEGRGSKPWRGSGNSTP